MKIIEQAEATAPLAAYIADVAQEPVIITVNGKPVATLVAIDNADVETVLLSTSPAFLALIERSRTRHRTEGGVKRRDAAPFRVKQVMISLKISFGVVDSSPCAGSPHVQASRILGGASRTWLDGGECALSHAANARATAI
jgi:antitoxin (DNA-binding transcriptional repressor) of toxin-antitoxin stability system